MSKVKLKFIYLKSIYEINNIKEDISINELLKEYCSKINQDINSLSFIYKGKN